MKNEQLIRDGLTVICGHAEDLEAMLALNLPMRDQISDALFQTRLVQGGFEARLEDGPQRAPVAARGRLADRALQINGPVVSARLAARGSLSSRQRKSAAAKHKNKKVTL